MGWFDEVGASIAPQVNAGYGGNTGVAGGGQWNPAGVASDPFAYTKGSLLTPWEGKFSYEGGDGGPGVAEFKAFNYDDFGFRAANPDAFHERYNDPGNFVYGDYDPGKSFQAPTEADMKMDPGYQARLKQGQKSLEASKAAQGVLRTGGAAKAMAKYGQEQASQEYGNVYGRKASEFDRSQGERRFTYQTNRGNAAENWDRNIGNARTAHQIRQSDWRGNADVALDASRHGYDVAQGTWDRNYSKAKDAHDAEQAHANAMAAASAAGASRDYNRALNEYQMSRDEFWTNQDRQYAILDREANRGYGAAIDYADRYSGAYADGANARASGYVGAANARGQAAGAIGNTISDLALYGATRVNSNRNPAGGYW